MSDGDMGVTFLFGLVIALIIGALLPNTSVTKDEWDFAAESCAANGGVNYTRGSGAIRSQKVVCTNKAEFIRKSTDE